MSSNCSRHYCNLVSMLHNSSTTDNKPCPKEFSIGPSSGLEMGLNGIATLVLIVLGVVGNALTIKVLTKQKKSSSSNCYLTGLVTWDTLVLLNTLLLITLPLLSTNYHNNVLPYIVVYVYPLALVSQTATLWITVAMTVNRYIVVCKPFQAKVMCNIRKSRLLIVIISLVSFLFNICRWFEYEIVEENHKSPDHNTTLLLTYNLTAFGRNQTFQSIYFIWLYSVILFLAPMSVLATLTAVLIRTLKKSNNFRRQMNSKQLHENSLTKLAVAIVALYMICHIPPLIYNIAYAAETDSIHLIPGWNVLSSVRNFLIPLNSAINFFPFIAFVRNYRKCFKQMFYFNPLKENNSRNTNTVNLSTRNTEYRDEMTNK